MRGKKKPLVCGRSRTVDYTLVSKERFMSSFETTSSVTLQTDIATHRDIP
jgi:hypothetical protein